MGWCKEGRYAVGVGSQKFGLTPVCSLEQSAIGETPDQAGVNNAGPTHPWDVTRARINSVVIPDRLARLLVMVDEKTAAVFLGEDAGKTPGRVGQIADVEEIDDHQIARFGSLDAKWSAQIMHFRQIDVANIVGAVVGCDLAARPVEAFNPKFCSGLIGFDERDIGMPSVV